MIRGSFRAIPWATALLTVASAALGFTVVLNVVGAMLWFLLGCICLLVVIQGMPATLASIAADTEPASSTLSGAIRLAPEAVILVAFVASGMYATAVVCFMCVIFITAAITPREAAKK